MNNIYYVIYETHNLINGKSYIGKHKTSFINDEYLGSGKLFKRALKKYGTDNFQKEILFVFKSETEAYIKEKQIVTKEICSNTYYYNLREGGNGGGGFTKEECILGRIAMQNAIQEKYGVDNPSKLSHNRERARQLIKLMHEQGKVLRFDWTGKIHKEESKKKIGEANKISQTGTKNSQFGTCWITNGKDNKKIKKLDLVPEGWYYGRVIDQG